MAAIEIRIIENGEPCCDLHSDHRSNALLYDGDKVVAIGKGDNWLTAIGRLVNRNPQHFGVIIKNYGRPY